MAVGDDALSGKEENNITHWFSPDIEKSRFIHFKGLYLSIYNKQSDHYKVHKDHASATTTYERFEVPAGYTDYVRVASVYFEV